MDFLRINWSTAAEYCEELAKKIDFRPDIIVGLSRGGLVPARILSDIMDVKSLVILGVAFYKKVGEKKGIPEITQDIQIDIKGKKILLVDDVADTGKSLMFAKEHLKDAEEIRTATIHYKPGSQIKPDYFVRTSTAWIVYPWEMHEVERELRKR